MDRIYELIDESKDSNYISKSSNCFNFYLFPPIIVVCVKYQKYRILKFPLFSLSIITYLYIFIYIILNNQKLSNRNIYRYYIVNVENISLIFFSS